MKKHEEKDFKHRVGTVHGADHDADGYRRGVGSDGKYRKYRYSNFKFN